MFSLDSLTSVFNRSLNHAQAVKQNAVSYFKDNVNMELRQFCTDIHAAEVK